MSVGTQDLLHDSLRRTFEDGTRRAVLVVGAGLHFHNVELAKGDPKDDAWRPFTNWNGLLSSLAEDFQLPVIAHADPAATWESLIARAAAYRRNESAKKKDEPSPVNVAERDSLLALARRLARPPMTTNALLGLGKGLSKYRDVVSLNIDELMVDALREAGAKEQKTPVAADMVNLRPSFSWRIDKTRGRVWQPHGRVSAPGSIVLGTEAYGKALNRLQAAWGCAKAAERLHPDSPRAGKWTPDAASAWWNHRRGVKPFEPKAKKKDEHGKRITLRLTWLDLFLGSDLIFIGTSLDRAETDLWWALHKRQRNLTRVNVRDRPLTFAIFEKECPRHLRTGPAGVTPVLFSSWKEAWRMLLDE
jgi:hypothetical protein